MLKDRASKILSEAATATLKTRGFKKRGKAYIRQTGRLGHMVDTQFSRWNDGKEVSFTLNCGIYIPGVTSTFSNSPEPNHPKLEDCCINVRVGGLTESKLDVWWKLSERDTPERDMEIREEICSTIERTMLPFLDRYQNEKAVAEFLSQQRIDADKYIWPRAEGLRLSYAAIIWHMLGVRDTCRECIERAVRESTNTPVDGVVNAFAIRFTC
jgi:hypothetical protein